jgi:hypothetical protein
MTMRYEEVVAANLEHSVFQYSSHPHPLQTAPHTAHQLLAPLLPVLLGDQIQRIGVEEGCKQFFSNGLHANEQLALQSLCIQYVDCFQHGGT